MEIAFILGCLCVLFVVAVMVTRSPEDKAASLQKRLLKRTRQQAAVRRKLINLWNRNARDYDLTRYPDRPRRSSDPAEQ